MSVDGTLLYTNFPVNEAIKECINLLYSEKYGKLQVDKQTFKDFLGIYSCNITKKWWISHG